MKNSIFAIAIAVVFFAAFCLTFSTATAQVDGWTAQMTPGMTSTFTFTDTAYNGNYAGEIHFQGTSTSDTVRWTRHFPTFKFYPVVTMMVGRSLSNGDGRYTLELHHQDTVLTTGASSYTWGNPSYIQFIIDTWQGALDSVDAVTIKLWYTPTANFDNEKMLFDALSVNGQLIYDFGDAAEIHGTVYNDANSNGTRDTSDSGIPNWLMRLGLASSGTQLDSTYTDKTGNFSFLHLNQGELYYVTQEKNNCWVPTTPDTLWLQLSQLHSDTTVEFGNHGQNAAFYQFDRRWNMASLPLVPCTNLVNELFPNAISQAFWYNGSYQAGNTMTPGKGYWLKLSNTEPILMAGDHIISAYTEMNGSRGWKMIGAISTPIPAWHVADSSSPGLISSAFFGYKGGYVTSDTLWPGKAYWVKCSSDTGYILITEQGLGKLQGKTLNKLETSNFSSVTFQDAAGNKQTLYFAKRSETDLSFYEMPPLPPAGMFDARFSSGRMAENFSIETRKTVWLQAEAWPVQVSWKILSGESYVLGGNNISGSGSTEVETATLTLALVANGKPNTFALLPNYPNPFNPTTTIEYQLPVDSRVTLKVYNLLGQIVVILSDEIQSAGFKSVMWNATGVASGVYLYRLDAVSVSNPNQSFSKVMKLVLIR